MKNFFSSTPQKDAHASTDPHKDKTNHAHPASTSKTAVPAPGTSTAKPVAAPAPGAAAATTSTSKTAVAAPAAAAAPASSSSKPAAAPAVAAAPAKPAVKAPIPVIVRTKKTPLDPRSAKAKSEKAPLRRALVREEGAATDGAAAEPEPEVEEKIPPREGLCQTELVPFALVTLNVYRDADHMVVRVNGKDLYRTTDYSITGDVLDLVTRVALQRDVEPNMLHVHFGDRFESLEAWTPTAEIPAPAFQIDEQSCPTNKEGLLQGRFPNTQVEDSELWKRMDMSLQRRRMVEKIGENAALLAKASVGQKNAMIASAINYETAQRDGDRGKLELQEGCSNDDNPFGKARYRVAGDTVEFFGAMTRNYTADKKVAFILPEEIRPQAVIEAQVFVDEESNTAEAMLIFNPDGNVEVLSLARFSPFDPAPETEVILLNNLAVKIK